MSSAQGPRLRISASQLSGVEDCPRCFWLERNGLGPPGSPFPGILGQLDSVTKDYTRRCFGRGKPPWFKGIEGTLVDLRNRLEVTDPASGVSLLGALDDLLRAPDGSYRVIDYKSGTPGLDKARLYYQHQMDAYAWLVEASGFKPVKDAVLIFFTPKKGNALEGSVLELDITPVPLATDAARIPPFLARVKDILSRPDPPPGAPDCDWCAWRARARKAGW